MKATLTQYRSKTESFVVLFSPILYPQAKAGLEIFNYFLFHNLKDEIGIKVATTCKTPTIKKSDRIPLYSRIFFVKKYGLSKLSIILSSYVYLIWLRKKIKIIEVSYTTACWHYGLIFPILKKIFNLKYSITVHSGETPNFLFFFLHQLLFENAKYISVVSEQIQIDFELIFKRKCQVVLPVVPVIENQMTRAELRNILKHNSTDFIILSLGSIKESKGSDVLLKAVIELLIEYPVYKNTVKLLFVGEPVGRLINYMIDDAKTNNVLNKNVFFLGGVEYENTSMFYKISDLYVIPSWYEGTSISLLGAMYHELLILGSNAPGINSIITNKFNGYLFKTHDIKDLKHNIHKILGDASIHDTLRINAKKSYSEKFDFEKTKEHYLRLFMNAV